MFETKDRRAQSKITEPQDVVAGILKRVEEGDVADIRLIASDGRPHELLAVDLDTRKIRVSIVSVAGRPREALWEFGHLEQHLSNGRLAVRDGMTHDRWARNTLDEHRRPSDAESVNRMIDVRMLGWEKVREPEPDAVDRRKPADPHAWMRHSRVTDGSGLIVWSRMSEDGREIFRPTSGRPPGLTIGWDDLARMSAVFGLDAADIAKLDPPPPWRPVPLHEITLDDLMDCPSLPEPLEENLRKSVLDERLYDMAQPENPLKAMLRIVERHGLGKLASVSAVEGFLIAYHDDPKDGRIVAAFDAVTGKFAGGAQGKNLLVRSGFDGKGLGREIVLKAFETGVFHPDDMNITSWLSKGGRQTRRSAHRLAVTRALAEGIAVREEVLAPYPDLVPARSIGGGRDAAGDIKDQMVRRIHSNLGNAARHDGIADAPGPDAASPAPATPYRP